MSRKTAVQKKGILRNKSTEKKEKKELKEVEFPEKVERSLQLKQTKEKDIWSRGWSNRWKKKGKWWAIYFFMSLLDLADME